MKCGALQYVLSARGCPEQPTTQRRSGAAASRKEPRLPARRRRLAALRSRAQPERREGSPGIGHTWGGSGAGAVAKDSDASPRNISKARGSFCAGWEHTPSKTPAAQHYQPGTAGGATADNNRACKSRDCLLNGIARAGGADVLVETLPPGVRPTVPHCCGSRSVGAFNRWSIQPDV